MRSQLALLPAWLLTVLFFGQSLLATPLTIRVPADQPTIQQAIDAANPEDTVLVSAGTYHERIDFHGKAITVRSDAGPVVTILDGDFSGAVVTFQSEEGTDSVLSGFKLQRGFAEFGAGITLSGASPLIVGNVFEDNWQGGGFGAAIGGNGCSPVIVRNVFRHNRCDNHPLSGVVSFVNYSSPLIANNIFLENQGRAVNMSLAEGMSPQIFNNLIRGNVQGIRVDARANVSDQAFRNNIVARNGCGLLVEFAAETNQPTWTHNLVYQNETNYAGISDQTGLNGNISTDPLFACGVEHDFHLLSGSPCIDSGNNSVAKLVNGDFEGNPREIDGNADSVAVVDMGPLEFDPSVPHNPCLYIICPSNVTVWAAAGVTSAVATYSAPEATAGAAVVTTPPSGSSFLAGTNTVTCVATLGTNSVACSFTVTVLAPPANDDFVSATMISSLPYVKVQDTTLATAGPDDVFCAGLGASVWYRLAAQANENVHVDTQGSDYPVSVSAYTGTQGQLTQIGCAFGSLKFKAVKGQTYHLLLSPFFRAAGGRLNLTVQAVPALAIRVQVDRRAVLNPRTGQVTLTGRIRSNRAVNFSLAGTLSQNRGRNRRCSADFRVDALCPGTASWSAILPAPEQPFDWGAVKVSLAAFAYDPEEGDAADSLLQTVVTLSRAPQCPDHGRGQDRRRFHP